MAISRILVVDDSPTERFFLSELLVKNGYLVSISDSVASNNRMHILEEARLAVLFQRARLGLVDSPTAAQALHLATLGGARALGLHDRIGSLEPGKEADLAAFPVAFGCGVPTHDPVAAAVFSLGSALASFVAVAGEPRVIDGRLVTRAPALEGEALAARVCRAAELLQDWERARLLAPPA